MFYAKELSRASRGESGYVMSGHAVKGLGGFPLNAAAYLV